MKLRVREEFDVFELFVHDNEANAHFDTQTLPGVPESCSVCHGPGRSSAVDISHLIR